MFRRSAIVVAALVAAATVLVAAPANAAAYGVSLSVSQTSADVGTTVTLSGKVTGKSSAGRTVYLQRQSGSTWSTVTTTKTTSKSTYAKAVKIPAAGTNSYRAVVKATSTVDRGQSATRTVTGWTWLDLAKQPTATRGDAYVGSTVTVAGKRYASSIQHGSFSQDDRDGYVGWYLAGLCDRSDVGFALVDGANGAVEVSAFDAFDDPRATRQVVSGARLRLDIVKAGSQFLNYEWTLTDENVVGEQARMLVPTPRAHCKVAQLPTFEQD